MTMMIQQLSSTLSLLVLTAFLLRFPDGAHSLSATYSSSVTYHSDDGLYQLDVPKDFLHTETKQSNKYSKPVVSATFPFATIMQVDELHQSTHMHLSLIDTN